MGYRGLPRRRLRRLWFQLLDTKSTNRKQTLLHFIANVVQDKFPDAGSFHAELHFLDQAALGEQGLARSMLALSE